MAPLNAYLTQSTYCYTMEVHMEIKTLKIGDIHPYGNNPRKNDKSAAAVARSIEEFG